MIGECEKATEKLHLVVLVHGLWGNRSHMDEISKYVSSLNDKDGKGERILVHQAHLNEGYKTYDGIDVCGIRVAKEIEEQLNVYGSEIVKFSLIGYSLGGLISRYSLGVLYQSQAFKIRDIELMNFVTFCTPHVGVLAPGNNVAVKLFNSTVPLVLGSSGKQMFLKDSYTGYPLVYAMSLPNSVFYKALSQFKYRSLYANIINDKRTAWWTSGISKNDPFIDVNENNGVGRFRFIKGYEPVVLDHNSPLLIGSFENQSTCEGENLSGIDFTKEEVDPQDFYFLNYWFTKMVRWCAVFINLIIIAPLWFIWFLISGSMETIKSAFRVTAFAKKYSQDFITEMLDISSDHIDQTDDDFSDSSSMLFAPASNIYERQIERSLTDQRDTLIESLFDAIERKETHTATVTKVDGNVHDEAKVNVTIKELEIYSIDEVIKMENYPDDDISFNMLTNFHLNIGNQQLEIIDHLNTLSWSKFPIYIRKTPSTHAASIIRHNDPNFAEGKVVLQHFVDNVFRTA